MCVGVVCHHRCFLGPNPRHVEVPRLGVESELQLPAYATATAMPDPSRISDLCLSSQQRSDQTSILMDTSQILNPPS